MSASSLASMDAICHPAAKDCARSGLGRPQKGLECRLEIGTEGAVVVDPVRRPEARDAKAARPGLEDEDSATREGKSPEILAAVRAIVPQRARNRMFTAYHPSLLIGPFVQGTYRRDLDVSGDTGIVNLGWTGSFNIGIRVQARLFRYGGESPESAMGAL